MANPGPFRPVCLSCKLISLAQPRLSSSPHYTSWRLNTPPVTTTTPTYSIHTTNASGIRLIFTSVSSTQRPQKPRISFGYRPARSIKKQHKPDQAMLDTKQGRFYDLESVDELRAVLAHDKPENYVWPEKRGSWGEWNLKDEGKWEISGLAKGGIVGSKQKLKRQQGHRDKVLKLLDKIQGEITNGVSANEVFTQIIETAPDPSVKVLGYMHALRIYIKEKKWELLKALWLLAKKDTSLKPGLRRQLENRLYKHLVEGVKKDDVPEGVWLEATHSLKRPFSNESLMFMLGQHSDSVEALRIYVTDHKALPDISVSNKAFAHEMAKLNNSGLWAGMERSRLPSAYWAARKTIYNSFTGYFDHDRVNTESIRLLLSHACDRDEVKRILHIALQAAERDPAVLRKTQHEFLVALRKFIPALKDVRPVMKGIDIPRQAHHAAHNLAELISFEHILKRRGMALSRVSLVSLVTASAMYGSSMNLNLLLPKVATAPGKLQAPELRKIVRTLPNEHGADLLTQRHRIVGNPTVWARHQQKLVLVNHLRQFVGDSEANLVEYIRALGRCRDTEEIWKEWTVLRDRGFKVQGAAEAKRVKDGTFAAFVWALAMGGDGRLAKQCFTEAQELAKAHPYPTILAGLMAYRPVRPSAFDGAHLPIIVGEVRWSVVSERLGEGGLAVGWSKTEKKVAKGVLEQIQKYMYYIKRGIDLIWAENAINELLSSAESRGMQGLGGRLSLHIPWPRIPTEQQPKTRAKRSPRADGLKIQRQNKRRPDAYNDGPLSSHKAEQKKPRWIHKAKKKS